MTMYRARFTRGYLARVEDLTVYAIKAIRSGWTMQRVKHVMACV